MEIPSYELTDFGFELLSLQPSTPAPNASNKVRLQLRFQRPLPLGQPINEAFSLGTECLSRKVSGFL
eukprot:symbB.v1.2.001202.t1/scaffold66.1/size357995/5